MIRRQIIAMGGGGFTSQEDKPKLDFILQSANKTEPKIAFLGQALGDSSSYIERFYSTFNRLNCRPTHLNLFAYNLDQKSDIEPYLLAQDIIWVGGGNTFNLLSLWRAWEVDNILKKAYRQGIVLVGGSAGSLCWFEEGTTDSFGSGLQKIECLGFLPGSHSPHHSNEKNRRGKYNDLILKGLLKPGIALDNNSVAHYINEELIKVYKVDETSGAWHVSAKDGAIVEKELEFELF